MARFLRFLSEQGLNVGAALGVAEDRVTFRRRVRTAGSEGPGWWVEVGRALEATGMEPFAHLPDGFAWGAIQGEEEWSAYRLLTERLTQAVRGGEVDPSRPGWRARSADLQSRWLDTPHPAFGGRSPREAIARERRERAPELKGLLEALRAGEASPDLPVGRLEEAPLEPLTGDAALGAEGALEEPDLERFPLPSLPPQGELQRAAEESVVMARVRALLELVGEGRPLTAKNRLTLADARALAKVLGVPFAAFGVPDAAVRSSEEVPAVHLTFAWARAAGFVKVAKGRVTPTRRGRAFGARPLQDWLRLFAAFVWKLNWPRHRHGDRWQAFWSDGVGALIPRYLEEVYRAAGGDGEPLLVREAAGWTWEALREVYDLSGLGPSREQLWRRMVEGDLRHGVFRPLADLGALEGLPARDPEPGPAARAGAARPGPSQRPAEADQGRLLEELRWPQAVRATPLGLWAVRRVMAVSPGFEPPLAAGEFAEALAQGGPVVLAALQALEVLDAREVESEVPRAATDARWAAGARPRTSGA